MFQSYKCWRSGTLG